MRLETKDLSRRRTPINFGSIVFPHLITPSASNPRILPSSSANGQFLMFWPDCPSLSICFYQMIPLMNSFIHSLQSTHSDSKSSDCYILFIHHEKNELPNIRSFAEKARKISLFIVLIRSNELLLFVLIGFDCYFFDVYFSLFLYFLKTFQNV